MFGKREGGKEEREEILKEVVSILKFFKFFFYKLSFEQNETMLFPGR